MDTGDHLRQDFQDGTRGSFTSGDSQKFLMMIDVRIFKSDTRNLLRQIFKMDTDDYFPHDIQH